MRKLKYIFIGMLFVSINLFGYSSQNTINDPFQQLNRNIEYNKIQQLQYKKSTDYLQQRNNFYGDNIQQPTYQQPVYQYSNGNNSSQGSGGNVDAYGWGMVIGFLLILML